MTSIEYSDRTFDILSCAYRVHSKLGPGQLEKIYEKALMYELKKKGFNAVSQQEIHFMYAEDFDLAEGLKVDIMVEDTFIIELKSVETLLPVHFKQLQSYLKLANKRQGWLINFNVESLRDNIHTVVNPFYK